MLKIDNINNNFYKAGKSTSIKTSPAITLLNTNIPSDLKRVNSQNVLAYYPSFGTENKSLTVSKKKQINRIKSNIDRDTQILLTRLEQKGILDNNNSNDGSTVLDNLYKIATEPRIPGLSTKQILTEVIRALDNPYSITQKFGDIPSNVAQEISQETGKEFPKQALNVVSSSCVVASMEFNLAQKMPAEFVRFAQGLSGQNYCIDKNINMSAIDSNYAAGLWKLKSFDCEHKIKDWDNVTVRIKPDRSAIVRARVQTSYKDAGERSCIDVLIQSALLNLGSQNTYDALTDERAGIFNQDKNGLTDFEKTFVETIVFGKPKISVVYQNIDENGYLTTKEHILKSLSLGQNVIVGYTHLDENKKVNGGHEITIVDYGKDSDGTEYFICNDTDDNLNESIRYKVNDLLPLIHHAGISKEALGENDIIYEPWREILDEFQKMLAAEKI